MKKIVISQDEEKILSHRTNLEETLPLVQQAFDLFRQVEYYQDTMGLADMLNSEHHRSQYKQKQIEGQEEKLASAFGLDNIQINATKVAEFIDIKDPPGFSHAVSEVRRRLQQNSLTVTDFSFTIAGKVNINRNNLKAFADRNSVLAETPEEIELYRLLMAFISSTEELDNFLRIEAGHPLLPKPLYPVKISDYFRYEPGEGYVILLPKFRTLKRALSHRR